MKIVNTIYNIRFVLFQPGLQYHLPPKRVEDNHSETSGDTGTSDSGRGGSDEEIHNSFTYSHRERPPGNTVNPVIEVT